jgi:adenosylhomocysteinase
MGATVTVTEVNPIRAIEAKMDGFSVLRFAEAVPFGDLFVTCTGQTGVIRKEHFLRMKDGAVLANAGHFDVEIDASALRAIVRPTQVRPDVERFDIAGKRIFLLTKGRVVNLVAAQGHPPEVMDLSFANQLLSILHLASNHNKMEKKLYDVPEKLDELVARYALHAMDIRIDKLTEQQRRYQASR